LTVVARRAPPGVLYMIGSFRFGGSERHVLEIVRRLDRGRFTPLVAVLHREGELGPAFEATGVPIHVVGIRKLLSFSTPRRTRDLAEFAKANGVAIIHGFNFHGNLYGALLASERVGMRLVTSERGVVEHLRFYHQWARRFYHRRSRRMLVNSEAVRNYVEEIPCRADGWLEVIPNGVDTARFDPSRIESVDRKSLGLPADGVVIGHVGRFREEKGQMYMLAAFKELAERSPEVCFLLVGGGPDSARVAAETARPPLAGRVAVLDYQADVRPFLRTMDMFVLPSRTEGMPNALLEAMAMGLTCVSTRVGGTQELLDDGGAGRLVDYGDVPALVNTLEALLEDRSARAQLAAAARRRAVERFSIDAMMMRYETIYEQELGSGPKVVPQ